MVLSFSPYVTGECSHKQGNMHIGRQLNRLDIAFKSKPIWLYHDNVGTVATLCLKIKKIKTFAFLGNSYSVYCKCVFKLHLFFRNYRSNFNQEVCR